MSSLPDRSADPGALRLLTPRLALRGMIAEDAAAFSRYRSDPEVARYQGWEAPYSLEQARRFITEMQTVTPGAAGRWFQLAITLRASGKMIGDVGFIVLAEDHRQAEIGFTLAAEHHGQGYGSEAVRAVLAFLFDDLNLHRVRANCDPRNTASARLMQRVGMRHEGRFIDSLWYKGAWASEDWYAILRREWQEARQAGDG